MKMKVLLILLILAGIPESFARPEYLTNLTAMYGDGSCGTCHINAKGGGALNSYGTLFENQSNFDTDPGAALRAIGTPPTANPTLTPTATSTPTATAIPIPTPAATTISATLTPATPGFGIVAAMVGLFALALLVRRNNK